MDTLTHALSGALVARVVAPRERSLATTRDCMALGFLAAAFPDADVVLSAISPLAYLYNHRGVTHSALLLPLWAALIAWIWSRLRRRPQALRVYFVVSVAAITIHILGDWITAFGTMLLAPFSDERFALSTTFIIDLRFSGIIVAGLVAALLLRRSKLPAAAALAVLAGYVGLQWAEQQRAIGIGQGYAAAQGLAGAHVEAVPRPVSHRNWTIVIEHGDRYHYAFVNTRREAALAAGPDAGFFRRLDAVYQPVASARWTIAERFGANAGQRAFAAEAFNRPEFGFFRWFAAYPLVAAVEEGDPSTCAWFQDLRFLTPGRGSWPFRYGICREGPDGRWQAYEDDDGTRVRL